MIFFFITMFIKNICNTSHVAACTTVFCKIQESYVSGKLNLQNHNGNWYVQCILIRVSIAATAAGSSLTPSVYVDGAAAAALLLQCLVFNHKYGHFPTIHQQLIIHIHCSYLQQDYASASITLCRVKL